MVRRLDRRDNIDDLFGHMQKMFNQFQEFGKELDIVSNVPVDVREDDGEVVITADMPGVQKEDINLKADSEGVEITAEAEEEYKEENEKYFRKERASRSYRRKVSWPSEVDPETIKAKYSDGVLTVKAEKESTDGWDVDIE